MANKERLSLLIELAKHVAALIARAISGTVVTNEELAEAKAEANTWRKKLLSLTKTQAVDPTPTLLSLIGELDDEGEPVAADLEPRPPLPPLAEELRTGPDGASVPKVSGVLTPVVKPGTILMPASGVPASQETAEKITGIVEVGTVEPTPEDERADRVKTAPQEDK